MSTYAMVVRVGQTQAELVCVKGFSLSSQGHLQVHTPAPHGIIFKVAEYRAITEADAVQHTLPSRLGDNHGVLVTDVIKDSDTARITFTYGGFQLTTECGEWLTQENKLLRACDAIKARLEEHLSVDEWKRSLPTQMHDVVIYVEEEYIRIQGKVFGVPFTHTIPYLDKTSSLGDVLKRSTKEVTEASAQTLLADLMKEVK